VSDTFTAPRSGQRRIALAYSNQCALSYQTHDLAHLRIGHRDAALGPVQVAVNFGVGATQTMNADEPPELGVLRWDTPFGMRFSNGVETILGYPEQNPRCAIGVGPPLFPIFDV